MPDQPDDPLHYEMKIPPETHKADDSDSDKPSPDENSVKSDSVKNSNANRGDDKPQAQRRPG
jgi:hypothetical protein